MLVRPELNSRPPAWQPTGLSVRGFNSAGPSREKKTESSLYTQSDSRCRLQLKFGDLFRVSPAHLRWIAGILKLARNANRVDVIFHSFISNMDRIVLLESVECQFSLSLVLVMSYVRRKEKLAKIRTRRKYWRTNHGQYHTLFADLRHPHVRHFPPPFWKSGIVGKIELLRHT